MYPVSAMAEFRSLTATAGSSRPVFAFVDGGYFPRVFSTRILNCNRVSSHSVRIGGATLMAHRSTSVCEAAICRAGCWRIAASDHYVRRAAGIPSVQWLAAKTGTAHAHVVLRTEVRYICSVVQCCAVRLLCSPCAGVALWVSLRGLPWLLAGSYANERCREKCLVVNTGFWEGQMHLPLSVVLYCLSVVTPVCCCVVDPPV